MRSLKVSNIIPNSGIAPDIQTLNQTRIASNGAPIQMLYYRTDERSSWSTPVGNQTVANPVTPLGLTITPKKLNSLIVMQWMINGESNWNINWIIYLNNSPINATNYWGYNGEPVSSGNWVGYVTGQYDAGNDVNSTMENYFIQYSFIPNTLSSLTFCPAVKSSDATARTFYLNRTAGNLGTDQYENAISNGIIMEIAQ